MEGAASARPQGAFRDSVALVPFAAALLVSALSWVGVCTDDCAEMHLYRLFGVPLPPFGTGYFALGSAAFLARRRSRLAELAVTVLLAGALGAEAVFIWIQKFVVGKWCPWCVGIAVCVVAACTLVALERLERLAANFRNGERKLVMKKLASGTLVVLVAFAAGLAVTAVGMKKPASAAGLSAESIAFGNAKSSIEVYFVTDWFCPGCRAAEPEIVKGAGFAMQRAKVVFVDYPIHRETLNYTPYNLSFMVHEKEKYLRIREALAALALKNREPMPEDVQAAVSPLGVKYVPLNYADVMAGSQYFNSVIQQLKVPGTPAVVVRDARTGKSKILRGKAALTSEGIAEAISEVSPK